MGWSFFTGLGRISLTLLLAHVVLFRELSRPLGLWQDFGALQTLGIVVGFTLLSGLAAGPWSRSDFRFGAEWLLRRLAR